MRAGPERQPRIETDDDGANLGLRVTRTNPQAFAELHRAEVPKPLTLPIPVREHFNAVLGHRAERFPKVFLERIEIDIGIEKPGHAGVVP